MIFANYNSTSPIFPEVCRALDGFISKDFGNPSEKNMLGEKARYAIEEARGRVASLVGAEKEEVVFCSGGTEACFNAIVGGVLGRNLKHFACSAVEHPAVLEVAEFLKRFGIQTTIIPVSSRGEIEREKLLEVFREGPGLLSIMYANNETGVFFPVSELAAEAKKYDWLVHTDAVQAVGKTGIDFKNLGVHFLSLSGHKIGALKGVGAFVVKQGTSFCAPIHGGGQERGFRGGTEAVPAIVSFGLAAERTAKLMQEGQEERVKTLRDDFEKQLQQGVAGVFLTVNTGARLSNTSSVRIDGVIAKDLVSHLSEKEVYISSGSACRAGSFEPSHVLKAMGVSDLDSLSTLRFSFGRETTKEDIQRLVFEVKEAVITLRGSAYSELSTLLTSGYEQVSRT